MKRGKILDVPFSLYDGFPPGSHYINTSVQKFGILVFLGYMGHSHIIWNTILPAKQNKTEFYLIWLDLLNVYVSIPHELIQMYLELRLGK